jgi:sugar lactone lactonase YvrE
MAGSLPVIGSSVQIYAAGNTGNGSAPAALLNRPLTTDQNGVFTITSNFTCPFSNSMLYVVASGGRAGASGVTNPGIVLSAVLGSCNSLNDSSAITVNETSTMVTAWTMAQFLSAGGHIGATATNSSGLLLAASSAANLINTATGNIPGPSFPLNGTAPIAKISTLANVLNACIVSPGPSSSACSQLYSATSINSSTPNNTLDAAMNLAQHPGVNVAAIYALSSASTAYAPQLSAAPPDWTLFVNFTGGGMNAPSALSIDSQGNIWVANYFAVASLFSNIGQPIFPSGITGNSLLDSYGGAVDATDTMWIANEESASSLNSGNGSITLLNSSGVSSAAYTSGGINFPLAVAFDTSGVAWIADYGNSHITLLSSSGSPLSGANGYTASNLAFPVAIATDSKCNAYVANQSSDTITRVLADGSKFTDFTTGSGPSGLAIDASDNVWVANYYASSVGLVSAAADVLSGSGFTAASLNQPQGIAVDGDGNAWVASYHGPALTELSSASSTTPGTLLSPTAGWAPDSGLLEPYAVAIDAAGNIWVSNFGSDTLTEFIGLAAPVKTPLLGPVHTP